MRIGIVGHSNIEKAQGVEIKGKIDKYTRKEYFDTKEEIESMLNSLDVDYNLKLKDIILVTGLSRGVDEIVYDIAQENNIGLELVLPGMIEDFENYQDRYLNNVRTQAFKYKKMIEYSKKTGRIIEIVEDVDIILERSKVFVDNCDKVFSYRKFNSKNINIVIEEAKEQTKYIGNIITIDDDLAYNAI